MSYGRFSKGGISTRQLLSKTTWSIRSPVLFSSSIDEAGVVGFEYSGSGLWRCSCGERDGTVLHHWKVLWYLAFKNALDFAATKLKGKVQNLELINGEMVEEIDRIQGKFDLIVAGYTIHHLDEMGKRAPFASLNTPEDCSLCMMSFIGKRRQERSTWIKRSGISKQIGRSLPLSNWRVSEIMYVEPTYRNHGRNGEESLRKVDTIKCGFPITTKISCLEL